MACSRCKKAREAAVIAARSAASGNLRGAGVSAAQVIAEIKAKVAEKLGRKPQVDNG